MSGGYTSTIPSLCNFVVRTGTSPPFFTLLIVKVVRHVTEMVIGFNLQQIFIEKRQDDEKREKQSSNYLQFLHILLRLTAISVQYLYFFFYWSGSVKLYLTEKLFSYMKVNSLTLFWFTFRLSTGVTFQRKFITYHPRSGALRWPLTPF
jgi:hypothetical protein